MAKVWLNQLNYDSISKLYLTKFLKTKEEFSQLELYAGEWSGDMYRITDYDTEYDEIKTYGWLSKNAGDIIGADEWDKIYYTTSDIEDKDTLEMHGFFLSEIDNCDQDFIKFIEDNPYEGLKVIEYPDDHMHLVMNVGGDADYQVLIHGESFFHRY